MKKNIKYFVIKLTSIALLILFFQSCSDHTEKINKQKHQNTLVIKNNSTIVFFGNSLTAGYGLDDPSDAFPSIIQKKIDSLKLKFRVVNAGVSGETTAGGAGRIDWILRQPVSIFILELGANDGLRGISISETKKNLQYIIDKVKNKYIDAKIILAGMKVPPNMGTQYAESFQQIFKDLAKINRIQLIPFLLEGVGGVSTLNQKDGIHPNKEGAKIVAQNVWEVLEPELYK